MGKQSYNDMVDGLKSSKKPNEPNPIRYCMYQGCTQHASSFEGGNYSCQFHETADYHKDVTQAIKQNKDLIRSYSKMVFWDSEDWHKNHQWSLGYSPCQRLENEPATIWLYRFHLMVAQKIRDDALEIIQERISPTTRLNHD